MANRSDRTSVLPRRLKRMIALIPGVTDEQRRCIRKSFIEAHKHALSAQKGAKPILDDAPVEIEQTASTELST